MASTIHPIDPSLLPAVKVCDVWKMADMHSLATGNAHQRVFHRLRKAQPRRASGECRALSTGRGSHTPLFAKRFYACCPVGLVVNRTLQRNA